LYTVSEKQAINPNHT